MVQDPRLQMNAAPLACYEKRYLSCKTGTERPQPSTTNERNVFVFLVMRSLACVMVDQQTSDLRVGGSTPSGCTNFSQNRQLRASDFRYTLAMC
jgi:hypothetical protein